MWTGCEGHRHRVLGGQPSWGSWVGHLPAGPEVGGMGKPRKGTPWMIEAWVTCLRWAVGTAVTRAGSARAALSDGH